MVRPLIVIFLLLCLDKVYSQPLPNQCFFAKKKGLIFNTTLILLPGTKNLYFLEYYTSGGGIFSGSPNVDTLLLEDSKFHGKNYTVSLANERIVIKEKNKKRKFKYQLKQICDTTVNRARNWQYRTDIYYQLKDKVISDKYWDETEKILSSTCHEKFIEISNELLNKLKTVHL